LTARSVQHNGAAIGIEQFDTRGLTAKAEACRLGFVRFKAIARNDLRISDCLSGRLSPAGPGYEEVASSMADQNVMVRLGERGKPFST
jgi:hypothetical protein